MPRLNRLQLFVAKNLSGRVHNTSVPVSTVQAPTKVNKSYGIALLYFNDMKLVDKVDNLQTLEHGGWNLRFKALKWIGCDVLFSGTCYESETTLAVTHTQLISGSFEKDT